MPAACKQGPPLVIGITGTGARCCPGAPDGADERLDVNTVSLAYAEGQDQLILISDEDASERGIDGIGTFKAKCWRGVAHRLSTVSG